MDPAVTRRVLDYMLFMNSKVLFKQARPAAPPLALLLRCWCPTALLLRCRCPTARLLRCRCPTASKVLDALPDILRSGLPAHMPRLLVTSRGLHLYHVSRE